MKLVTRTRQAKAKRILITAGPTWVRLDSVRVISNIASGATGIALAQACARMGFKVTLLLGPVGAYQPVRNIRLVRFAYFDELRKCLRKELARARYEVIIHSAAVSDFAPVRPCKGKIASGKGLTLKLVPLPKLITFLRNASGAAVLVMFKLETGVTDAELVRRARHAQKKYHAQVCVANQIMPYRAYIINERGDTIEAKSKQDVVRKLAGIVRVGLRETQ